MNKFQEALPAWIHWIVVVPTKNGNGTLIGAKLYYHNGSFTRETVTNVYTEQAMIFSRSEFLGTTDSKAAPAAVADDMPKQERYKVEGTEDDFIDVSYHQMPWDRFVGAMQFTIGKYFDRFGRKDDIVKEAYKIKDYANRFYEKVLLESKKKQVSPANKKAIDTYTEIQEME